MICIVSDSHLLDGDCLDGEFKAMLEQLSKTGFDVVFLGDIMDLWIGKARYETGVQREFLAWCKGELSRRKVCFIEGNHEFFVAKNHREDFTESAQMELRMGDVLFHHGHTIQGSFFSFNRRFIPLCKSWFGNLVLSLMPFGRRFARLVKRWLGNRYSSAYLPIEAVEAWAKSIGEREGEHDLFIGHFHKAGEIVAGETRCHALPAWKSQGEIALFEPEHGGEVKVGPWRKLLL